MNRNGNVPVVPRQAVITGLAACSSLGQTSAFLDALLDGRSGIRPITTFDPSTCRSRLAAELLDFDAAPFIAPMKLRRMDEVGALAVVSARLALESARLPRVDGGYDDVGVVLGTCTCGVHSTGEFLDRLLDLGPAGAPALLFSNTVGNAAASLIALEEVLRGPNTTVSYKEASGLAAVAHAADLVRDGRAGAIVTGGVEDIYDLYFQVHDWFGVLSSGGGYPEGARPFDATRNGFVLGEGGYLVVLEDGARAAGRGVPTLGEVVGVGASSGVTAVNAWPSHREPLVRAMRLALAEAGITSGDVGAVYAAANGAEDFDTIEADAIATVFDGHAPLVTSVKGAVGEGGMAGAASPVAAVLGGQRGLGAPTAGLTTPDPRIAALPYVIGAPVPLPSPYILINSFASGGASYSLVLRVN